MTKAEYNDRLTKIAKEVEDCFEDTTESLIARTIIMGSKFVFTDDEYPNYLESDEVAK